MGYVEWHIKLENLGEKSKVLGQKNQFIYPSGGTSVTSVFVHTLFLRVKAYVPNACVHCSTAKWKL